MSDRISFCCEEMRQSVKECNVIHYNEVFDEYGISLVEDDVSYILLNYCPWCGKVLPTSKRLAWFEQLEELGFENPLFRDDLPMVYRSSEWYLK